MKQPKSNRISLRRIAIIFSVILGLAHVILLGWTLQRQNAASQLAGDEAVLAENLDQLQLINQAELDSLQAELEVIQTEITDLENSFPVLGAPFAIYQQGYNLALQNQLDLLELSLITTDQLETFAGLVVKEQYNIELTGSLGSCLAYLEDLEHAGADTIILDYANFLPADNRCSLEISTLGHPSE